MSESFTFFWSENSPFSQWHPAVFRVDDVDYRNAEQFMMAEKARLFGDAAALDRIMKAVKPGDCKALGREVKPYVDETWKAHAKGIVYKGNVAKFSQNPPLLEKLMATRGTTLVEASPYDPLWGIGLRASDPRASDRSQWRGLNWLGETLTRVRDYLDRLPTSAEGVVRNLGAGVPVVRGLAAPPKRAASPLTAANVLFSEVN